MNWITTNLRIPEDVYVDLKIQAAKERRSVASVIRERITKPTSPEDQSYILKKIQSLGKKIAKEHKDLDLSKKIIEMRYEQ